MKIIYCLLYTAVAKYNKSKSYICYLHFCLGGYLTTQNTSKKTVNRNLISKTNFVELKTDSRLNICEDFTTWTDGNVYKYVFKKFRINHQLQQVSVK